ncbi:hypothetical protein HK405_015704, partial [Cladochytrium tenue]
KPQQQQGGGFLTSLWNAAKAIPKPPSAGASQATSPASASMPAPPASSPATTGVTTEPAGGPDMVLAAYPDAAGAHADLPLPPPPPPPLAMDGGADGSPAKGEFDAAGPIGVEAATAAAATTAAIATGESGEPDQPKKKGWFM